jgi:transcriptional regulator with XRE-family HTH domain
MSHDESEAYAVVLGRVIAALRERRSMTQAELAALAGIRQSTISRIENGQVVPDALVFRRIATAFGLTTDQLNAKVDAALERTEKAARGATDQPDNSQWWDIALKVAGIAGLIGLATFAVGALLSDSSDDSPESKGKPPSKTPSPRSPATRES